MFLLFSAGCQGSGVLPLTPNSTILATFLKEKPTPLLSGLPRAVEGLVTECGGTVTDLGVAPCG